jgi:NAD(P)-dependent dehydrogenase (short-subunit alcohol dehydrogenase family)
MSRRVIVIGGTSQIGQAVVRRLADRGDRVVFNGTNRDVGERLAAETGADFLACDYLEPGAAEHIVGGSVSVLGGLDGVVLAGGLLHPGPISETSDADWDAVMESNLIAPFRIARAAMWELSKDGGGAIVTIASGTALRPEVTLGAYSVAKKAVHWLTNMLAVEGGPRGIAANTICPGDLPGGMANVTDPAARDALGKPFIPPAGRLTAPEDIARSVDFLLSAGSAVTGAALVVDGGLRAALRASKVHQP